MRNLPKLLIALCALLCPTLAFGQNGVRWDGMTLSPSGKPVSASVAVCNSPGLLTTGAQVIGNTAILTFATSPITAGFAANMQIAVSGFTGGDTYFNVGTLQPFSSTVTITAVSSTTITFPLTHANASASSNGSVFQMGNIAQACAPLASIFSDANVSVPITQPGFVSSNIGNVGFYVNPGQYAIQYYGTGITTYLQPLTLTMVFLNGNNAFTGNNTHSGTEAFNGAVTETATHALSNAGVFTNTQFNEYLTSSINGCSSGAQYRLNPINPNTPFVTEALTGCVTVPVGSTVVQANGISGFTNTSSTVTNAVGVYGQARAGANNVTMWGANFVTDDCPGGYTLLVCNSVATNTGGSGIEIDVNANSTTTKVQGLTITGLWNAQPSGLANAIRIHALEQGGACTTCSWNGGLVFDAGATVGGLNSPGIFLPVAALSGVNVQSQTIRLESNDPIAGQNEAQLFENAVGNVAFTTSKANATAILNGNAFLNRVTAASTTQPGGVQTQRVAAGCVTGAAVGAACTTVVSWPVTFGDSLYTPTCNGFGITSGVPVNGGITAVANASVTFQTVATTAAAAQYTNISCTAVHD